MDFDADQMLVLHHFPHNYLFAFTYTAPDSSTMIGTYQCRTPRPVRSTADLVSIEATLRADYPDVIVFSFSLFQEAP